VREPTMKRKPSSHLWQTWRIHLLRCSVPVARLWKVPFTRRTRAVHSRCIVALGSVVERISIVQEYNSSAYVLNGCWKGLTPSPSSKMPCGSREKVLKPVQKISLRDSRNHLSIHYAPKRKEGRHCLTGCVKKKRLRA